MSKPLSIATVTALSLFLLFSVSLAQNDPFPTWFHGTIAFDGVPASAGTEIVAKINGVVKGSLTTTEPGTYGNETGYPKLVVNPGETGDTILFFAKKPSLEVFIQANENATFDSQPHTLNLTFPLFCGDNICDTETESCSICSQDCGACSPPPQGDGGNGGGGGGGGAPPQQPEEEEEPEVTEPPGEEPSPPEEPEELEQPPPETPEEPTPPTPAGFDITGFFTQNPAQSIFGAAVILIVILGLLIYWGAIKQKNVTKRARGKKTQR